MRWQRPSDTPTHASGGWRCGPIWASAAEDRPERAPYLRVLGFNERGRAVLREMEGRAQAPILTKPAHARDLEPAARRLFELEARCTDLYGLVLWQSHGPAAGSGPQTLCAAKRNKCGG